ncbi:MAG: AbgT family transporter [Cyanobacteria bacterium J06649_11]
MSNHTRRNKPNLLDKSLAVIETLGNKLPDPITLFFILSTLVIIISAIAASLNISVVNPGNDKTISAVSLLTPESIRKIFSEAVNNFTGFKPLGTVLVAMLGVGVAESTGLLSALLKQIVLIAPARFICPVVVFAGVMGNIASDAAIPARG